jgi:hypothetical protein
MKIENINWYLISCHRLMKIEHYIRYAELAMGLKPSAIQSETYLCG